MLIIATDGACKGNPGPGGWAWVTEKGESMSGGEASSTNNRMELMAVREALATNPGVDVTIQTDSELIVNTFTKWVNGWKARGWRKKTGEIANVELIKEIDQLIGGRVVRWEHVRGHAGHGLNEQADALASAAAEKARSLPASQRTMVLPDPNWLREGSRGTVGWAVGAVRTVPDRPAPGSVEYLREALDFIDGHAPEDASEIAAAALAGSWQSPECCSGHGLERRR